MITEKSKALFWMQAKRTKGGCWEWHGAKNKSGYGVITMKGISERLAHRISFYLCKGKALEGHGCHVCNNPPCINPDHIFEGDDALNMAHCRESKRTLSGSRNVHAKLTEADVLEIRKKLEEGVSKRILAAQYNVSLSLVFMIARRAIWTHI